MPQRSVADLPYRLTRRLRLSLRWFLTLLQRRLKRVVPLCTPVTRKRVLLFSDADVNGGIGAVAVFSQGEVIYLQGSIQTQVMQLLQKRKTNIVAFELLAAVVALASAQIC